MATDTLTSHRIHTRTQRATTIWSRALLGLIVGGLLLTLGARTAEAAPPTVTISPPSPVCFNQASGTKQVALTYNLNGTPAAWLHVRDDTAKTVALDKPVIQQTGTEPLTVTYGHVYSVQMLDPLTSQNLLRGPITITTKVCDVVPPCVDCFKVTDIGLEPHGTWARFNINANQTAGFKLEISKSPPVSGKLSGIVFSTGTAGMVASPWKPGAEPLEADDTYHYLVTATNAKGDVATKGGSFTTLKRKVEVRFDKIFIVDDSDGGSEGDLYFRFGVFTGPNESSKSIEAEADTGQSVVFLGGQVPLAMFVENDVSATLTLKVQGCDDDQPDILPVGTGCTYTQLQFGKTGSNADADFTYVEKTFNHLVGPDESAPVSFKLQAAGGALKFNVHGSYTATYQ